MRGEAHPETLASARALGTLYWSQGHYDRAEPLLVEALEQRRRVLGEEHPDTLAALNILAVLYQEQGRLSQAQPFYEQSLEILRKNACRGW